MVTAQLIPPTNQPTNPTTDKHVSVVHYSITREPSRPHRLVVGHAVETQTMQATGLHGCPKTDRLKSSRPQERCHIM